MRAAVLGGGGVGGWLGAMLQQSGAVDEVIFLGRPGSAHTLALQVCTPLFFVP